MASISAWRLCFAARHSQAVLGANALAHGLSIATAYGIPRTQSRSASLLNVRFCSGGLTAARRITKERNITFSNALSRLIPSSPGGTQLATQSIVSGHPCS